MARRLVIKWRDGDAVTGRLAVPQRSSTVGVLLAHGAGAGQEHPWITRVRDGLVHAGFPVLTFDYPYMEAGRRAPDRPPVLLACHAAAAARLLERCDTIVLAGKSMGGRIGAHLAAGDGPMDFALGGVGGLVFFGYPLVAVGKTEPRAIEHLHRTRTSMLFVSGTRDRLGPIDLMRSVVAELPGADLVEVADGDHSLRVPKRSGRSNDDVLADVVGRTASWIRRRVGPGPHVTRAGG